MHAISKRTFLFVDFAAAVRRKFTLKASPAPQDVPDWVRELDSYKFALKAKEIREVQFITQAVDAEEDAEEQITESAEFVKFLQTRNYDVKVLADADKLVKSLKPKERKALYAEFEAWQVANGKN
jgi:hypothetical protein